MRNIRKTEAFDEFYNSIDEENFIEANEILLLNGFLKKSTKDYKPQLKKAEEMIKGLSE